MRQSRTGWILGQDGTGRLVDLQYHPAVGGSTLCGSEGVWNGVCRSEGVWKWGCVRVRVCGMA